jgi:hypothetical protein
MKKGLELRPFVEATSFDCARNCAHLIQTNPKIANCNYFVAVSITSCRQLRFVWQKCTDDRSAGGKKFFSPRKI